MSNEKAICALCGEPMPEGEESFKYHGFSGPCPKPQQTSFTTLFCMKVLAERLKCKKVEFHYFDEGYVLGLLAVWHNDLSFAVPIRIASPHNAKEEEVEEGMRLLMKWRDQYVPESS